MKKTIFLLALLLLVGAAASWAGVFMNVPWYTSWGDTPSTIYSGWTTWYYQHDGYIKGLRCSYFHNDENNVVMVLEYSNDNELVGITYYTEDVNIGASFLTSMIKHYGQGTVTNDGDLEWTNVLGETVTIETGDKGMTVWEEAD
jgi:hypothetical protein